MKKRNMFFASITLASALTLTACGSTATDSGSNNGGDSAKGLKVAYVTSGNLGDKSFFDSGAAGLERAKKDFGISYKVIQSTNSADWEPNLEAAAQAGYDLVVTAASQMHDAVTHIAPKYPKVKFVYVDDVVNGDNIASITFAQNEGSFETGALAALITQQAKLPNVKANHTYGWIGGMDIAVLHDFLVGFEQGAKYVDPQAKFLVSWAGSFSDPAKGKEMTLAQFNQGASVVADVAGGTGIGILEAANDAGKYAIGVDSDQDNLYPGHVLTSMIKHVDNAVYDEIKAAHDGQWKSGHLVYGYKNNGIGITDMSVMGDKISQDIRDKLKDIENKIGDGTIKVDHYQGYNY